MGSHYQNPAPWHFKGNYKILAAYVLLPSDFLRNDLFNYFMVFLFH